MHMSFPPWFEWEQAPQSREEAAEKVAMMRGCFVKERVVCVRLLYEEAVVCQVPKKMPPDCTTGKVGIARKFLANLYD